MYTTRAYLPFRLSAFVRTFLQFARHAAEKRAGRPAALGGARERHGSRTSAAVRALARARANERINSRLFIILRHRRTRPTRAGSGTPAQNVFQPPARLIRAAAHIHTLAVLRTAASRDPPLPAEWKIERKYGVHHVRLSAPSPPLPVARKSQFLARETNRTSCEV